MAAGTGFARNLGFLAAGAEQPPTEWRFLGKVRIPRSQKELNPLLPADSHLTHRPMTTQPSRRPVSLLAALATTAAAGAAYLYLRRKNYAPLPTVPHVELERYLGRWYEVARLPVPFEKNCEHVTAEY